METYQEAHNRGGLKMWMDISTYCNAACPQCHRTNPNGLEKQDFLPLIQWSLKDFKECFSVETMKKISLFDFCGTWGDPVMNKDIFEITEYILNESYASVKIHTNGSIRDDEWWYQLGLLGKKSKKRLDCRFAVEGIDQETHSKYRQKTDLDLILSNIEAFNLGGGIGHIFTIIFKHNQDQLLDIAKKSMDIGCTGISYMPSNRFKLDKYYFVQANKNVDVLERTTLPPDILEPLCSNLWKDIDSIKKILKGEIKKIDILKHRPSFDRAKKVINQTITDQYVTRAINEN